MKLFNTLFLVIFSLFWQEMAFSQCNGIAQGGVLTCNSASIRLRVTGINPFQNGFIWSGPGINNTNINDPEPLVSEIGDYTVIITDTTNNCTSTSSTTVIRDLTKLTINIDPVRCHGELGSILIPNFTSGQVTWSNGSTNSILQDVVAGNYCVSVSDFGGSCSIDTCITLDSPEEMTYTVDSNVGTCAGDTSTYVVTIMGGVLPYNGLDANTYTIVWPTSTGGGPSVIITLLRTIIDANVCSLITGVTLGTQSNIYINTFSNQAQCFNTFDGNIFTSVSGGIEPYQFNWTGANGFTSQSKNLDSILGGMYNLTVTDALGCTSSSPTWVDVKADQPIENCIEISNLANPENCEVVLKITSTCNNLAFFWSNGQATPSISTAFGTYQCTIVDLDGCTFITPPINISDNTNCNKITGKINLDANSNCLFDSLEMPVAHWIVRATNITTNQVYYAMSNDSGYYNLGLALGNYTIEALPISTAWGICGTPITVNFPQQGDSISFNFMANIVQNCPQLTVDLSIPILRRCFDNNYYQIKYCNNGTQIAENAYVILNLDELLILESAQIPYIDLGNNQFRFEVGNVAVGQCGNFWARVNVSCNAVIGQSHCSEVHVYPDTLCQPNSPLWSGADVLIGAVCEGDSVRFTIKNQGIAPMSSTLDYIVIEDGVMLFQGAWPPLGVGDSIQVLYPANGSTWRLEASQEPYHPLGNNPAISVEGCTITNSFTTGYVAQFPPDDIAPFLDIDCTTNVGSYDPNDKNGFPVGFGASHYIRPNTDLEYLIRFQNTGTDTAFTVLVRDTLSQWLDPASIRAGASSHPYQLDLTGNGVLSFRFENILLPDSNTNEVASHGFLKYRISQKTTVPLETDILNRAGIFFDYNLPVMTNTTVHKVGVNFMTLASFIPQKPTYLVKIMPNPMQDAAILEITGVPNTTDLTLKIFDQFGILQHEMQSDSGKFLVQNKGFSAGVYFFKIERNGLILGNGKLMVGF
jgi:hypothetical protein